MSELWYTLGPASLGKEEELLRSGATGVRLTFSFGTPQLQQERATLLKEAAARTGLPCRVIADLAGEKFRLGTFSGQPSLRVRAGDRVRLVAAASLPAPQGPGLVLPVSSPAFFSSLGKGAVVVVGDGSALLTAVEVGPGEVLAEAISDGVIDQCRGLIVQGSGWVPSPLTDKDLADLDCVLASPAFDAVALSFVGSDAELKRVRERIQRAGRTLALVAKIETPAGVANADAICRAADVVMAARGDLALTAPWTELPAAVRAIAASARAAGKPWLLATQVAEGLERFAFPSRAEICDLAHWLAEGCAGVLLSYETAFGSRPTAAVSSVASLLARWGSAG